MVEVMGVKEVVENFKTGRGEEVRRYWRRIFRQFNPF